MHPHPNKFLMTLFSFVPGAAHMYLGLLRRGVSFMLGFALSIAGAGMFMRFDLLEYVFIIMIPVLWFVAFFDFWRYPRMAAEEKAGVKDDFLLPFGMKFPQGAATRRVRLVGGILLVIAGAFQLYRTFLSDMLYMYLHSHRVIYFFDNLPTLLGGLTIIIVGLLLIFWKSRQLKKEGRHDAE